MDLIELINLIDWIGLLELSWLRWFDWLDLITLIDLIDVFTFDLHLCRGSLVTHHTAVHPAVIGKNIRDLHLVNLSLLAHVVPPTRGQTLLTPPPLHRNPGFSELTPEDHSAPFWSFLVLQVVFKSGSHSWGINSLKLIVTVITEESC